MAAGQEWRVPSGLDGMAFRKRVFGNLARKASSCFDAFQWTQKLRFLSRWIHCSGGLLGFEKLVTTLEFEVGHPFLRRSDANIDSYFVCSETPIMFSG